MRTCKGLWTLSLRTKVQSQMRPQFNQSLPLIQKNSLLVVVATLALGVCVWCWAATCFRTSWETLQSRLPSAANNAGWHIVEQRTLGSNIPTLTVSSRIRQILHPQRALSQFSGFPNSAVCYTLESDQSHAPVQCCVRYSEGMVLRLWVRHTSSGKQEAIVVRDVLRQAFPGERVDITSVRL
jgi:hypothetical protein